MPASLPCPLHPPRRAGTKCLLRGAGGALAALLATLAASTAWAEARPSRAEQASRSSARTAEGLVVAIDGGELVLDLGLERGASLGDIVELWRPLRVKHPVTGQLLTDRFLIGRLRLGQVRPKLALASVEGATSRAPMTGDVVVAERKDATPSEPSSAVQATTSPSPTSTNAVAKTPCPARDTPVDADADELSKLFVSLAGAPPERRAKAYDAFVRKHPATRFAIVLGEEARALEREKQASRPVQVRFEAPTRTAVGAPARLAVELDPRALGAVLHVRRSGAPAYASLPMSAAGPHYWAADIPTTLLREPTVEYFIEGVGGDGGASPVVGAPGSPEHVAVDGDSPKGKAEGTLLTATLMTDYAVFNSRRSNDDLWLTEGTFGWRFRDRDLRAMRSGFGVLRGKGGTLAELDELGRPPRNVGLSYGYVETEAGLDPRFALLGRAILGLREGGVNGGAQGFLRIGHDLGTNLLLGGEVLGGIGQRGIVELDWRTIPRVPIVLRTEVTNQPAGAGGDVGVRAIGQVGYELSRELTLAARGSYQGRTINHAGPGAGAAVSYQW